MQVNKSGQRPALLRPGNLDVRKRRITSVVMDAKGRTKKSVIVQGLAEAREDAVLAERVSEEDLTTQQDPIMSPLIWDYGHIGSYEELWLLQKAHGKMLSKREALRHVRRLPAPPRGAPVPEPART